MQANYSRLLSPFRTLQQYYKSCKALRDKPAYSLGKRKPLLEETCELTFISRYSCLLSPFRTLQQYYKPSNSFKYLCFHRFHEMF